MITGIVTMFFALLASPTLLLAADAPKKSSMNNPIAIVIVVVIVALLIVIALLSYVLLGIAQFYVKRAKEQAQQNGTAAKTTVLLLCCLAGFSAFAQTDNAAVVTDRSIGGLSEATFFTLMAVIAIELAVIAALAWFLKRLMAKEETRQAAEIANAVPKDSLLKRIWDRANRFRAIHEEADIDLGHDYDSIRELDNRLPPWWLYGFYCTVIFAAIYLWRAEVSKSAPSAIQEYTASVVEAEKQKEIYLANAANNVDENSVKLLGADGIAAGKMIFTGTCAACHGTDGGGGVGPNLTDDYWLHGGTLKDVFKTIKYGVQEKGMKSWKDDLSPVQIAQLASFVKSIKGTKPATPKEPQGEPFKENTADSANATKTTASITQ